MKHPFEGIVGVLCILSIVCFVLVVSGLIWLAVMAFMEGTVILGLLLTAGVGIILFLASVLLWAIGNDKEVEKCVGM